MRRLILVLAALVALFGAGVAIAQSAPTFPPLTGYVVDNAHLLQPAEAAALDARLSAFRTQSQRQIVVATLPDLGGDDIEDYANRLLRAWGLGDKQRNDGLLVLIVPSEHKVKIEVGYGLEGIVTDALSSVIISQAMAPRFRAGDYAGGINAATDALIQQLRLPDDQARAVAAQAQARARQPHFDAGALVFLVIFVLFFVLPFLRMMTGGGRRYGGGVWILPFGFGSGGWGGGGFGGGWGGSDWGGGGRGDDDFMGGGGSSGGGGATGSW
jgi:uncharacterized protein